MTRLAVGDYVQWRSQSQGYTKIRSGRVVAIVHAGEDPVDVYIRWRKLKSKVTDFGSPRNHESYLVEVQTGKTAIRLYWPRVNGLRKAKIR